MDSSPLSSPLSTSSWHGNCGPGAEAETDELALAMDNGIGLQRGPLLVLQGARWGLTGACLWGSCLLISSLGWVHQLSSLWTHSGLSLKNRHHLLEDPSVLPSSFPTATTPQLEPPPVQVSIKPPLSGRPAPSRSAVCSISYSG